ncbi:hypothetical protein PanWU01x14_138050 [Parasponia andersonii]|uniref:Transmembrane protein n=1 Tax=Parasponia andersonii TaxID=3476 RepID=A0A2P5CN72_PARAD|nr:hypothetical protein PanWU01x14_138050 [Parasponia andersonii]
MVMIFMQRTWGVLLCFGSLVLLLLFCQKREQPFSLFLFFFFLSFFCPLFFSILPFQHGLLVQLVQLREAYVCIDIRAYKTKAPSEKKRKEEKKRPNCGCFFTFLASRIRGERKTEGFKS